MATAYKEEQEELNINTYDYKKGFSKLKELFSIKAIICLVLSFVIASLKILDVQPFPYVMIAVAIICNINMVFPFVATVLSYMILGGQMMGMAQYLIVFALMFGFKFIFYRKGTSQSLIIIALATFVFLVHGILGAFSNLSMQLIYACAKVTLFVVAFCPVFISGCKMLFSLNKHYIFSKEEVIGLQVVITVAISRIYPLSFSGFVISNILLLTLCLVVAWRNDWLFGIASGTILGLVYAIITGETPLVIIVSGVSGLLGGILRDKNKIVVAIVCFLCNCALIMLYGKDTTLWVKISEVFVVSGIMLALPKKATYTFQAASSLPVLGSGYNNLLGPAVNIEEQISSINNILTNMVNITEIEQNSATSELQDVIQKYIQDFFKANKVNFKDLDIDISSVSRRIVYILDSNQKITDKVIPGDFAHKDKLIEGLNEVYSNMKFMRVIRAKDREKSAKAIEEYKMFSNLLRNIVKGKEERNATETATLKAIRDSLKDDYKIYEDFYTHTPVPCYEFITDIITDIKTEKDKIQNAISRVLNKKMVIKLVLNSSKTEKSKVKVVPSSKYVVSAVAKQVKKTDSEQSGDSYLVTEQKNNNKIIAISDGVGSGKNAKGLSQAVINIVENMSRTGMDNKDIAIMLNKILDLKEPSYMSATLDMCILNEEADMLDFIKLGATSSYIITDSKIIDVKNSNDTLGTVSSIMDNTLSYPVESGMYIIMFSDGASRYVTQRFLESTFLKKLETYTEIEVINKIMDEVLAAHIIEDDVTIIVAKVN